MSLDVTELDLPGVLRIEGRRFRDDRGWFQESWKASAWKKAGIDFRSVQGNLARSSRGVIRGLHWQVEPTAQAKLVRCVVGRILDVAVDLRRDRPTFGRWVGVELSSDENVALLVPRGFAHGYQVLSDEAVVAYEVDGEYAPDAERALRWDDPEVGIEWRDTDGAPRLSDKDRAAPPLSELGAVDLF